MARDAELRARITAKDDASKVIDKVADAADDLEDKPVEVEVKADTKTAERDISGLLAKVDKLGAGEAANLLLTTNATQVASDIADLVIDLDRLDATDPTVDVKVDQLQRLQGDLDQIQAKAKELNSTPISLDTSQATTGLDNIGKSAGSSKSVLANMVGNATQDLGALGGVAGSAGVAIGQMGEYMVDAANDGDKLGTVLRNFGKIAAPIAAITVVVSAIGSIFQAAGDRAKRAAEQVKAFTGSLGDVDSATSAVEGLSDQMLNFDADARTAWGGFVEGAAAAAKSIPLIGGLIGDAGQNISNVIPTFNKLKISADDIGEAAARGGSAWDGLQSKLYAAQVGGHITSAEYAAASQVLYGFRDAAEASAAASEFLGLATGKTGSAAEELAKGLAEIGLKASAEDGKEYADGLSEAAAAMVALDAAVTDANIALIEGIDASEAFASALDRVNEASELDFSQMALDTVSSFDDMKGSLEGLKDVAVDWSTVDLTPDSVEELKGIPDELAAVTGSISGMRDSIQTELQAAFDTGGIEAYTAKADFFAAQIREQMPAAFMAAGASADEAAALTEGLLDEINLLPEDKQIMIQLTREEEARNALETFRGVIDQMPDAVQVAINTAIAQGDIEGALAILNDQLINRGYPPIVLPIDADPATAQGTVAGFVGATEGTTPVMPVDANPDQADDKVHGFVSATEGTTPVVPVDSNTRAAIDNFLALKFFIEHSDPVVDVKANTFPAAVAIAALAGHPWHTTVTASANTGSAEAELNSLARPRSASINVTVRRTEVLTRVDGGG